MNEKEEKDVMLYIPLGVNTRIDFFTGFGKKELAQAMVGIFLGCLIALLGYIITQQAITVIVILILFGGGSILATTKGSTNQSVADMFLDMRKFGKERKIYPYRQIKEWE